MRRPLATAALFLSLAIPAIAQEDAVRPPVEPDRVALQRVVGNAIDGYIVPRFAALRDASTAMKTALGEGCADPDAVRQEFTGLIRAWAATDFLRFGPMLVENRYERFAFWPDPHGTGTRQLRRLLARPDPDLLIPEAIAKQSAAIQGLPALEALLFSPQADDLDTAGFRCDLATAVAGNLETIAAAVLADWTRPGGWRDLLLGPSADNPVYRTAAEAATEMLKAVLTGLEQLRDQRILPPLGDSREDASAGRAPYGLSGLTLAYWLASAKSIADFTEISGLPRLVPERDRWIAGSIGFEFGNLERAIDEAEDPVASAILLEPSRGSLEYAAVVLGSLRELFQMRLAPAIGLSPGFNALDGD